MNPDCPICRQPLEGPSVTSELLADIINRQEREILNSLTVYYLAAEYLSKNPGANPEEVYNMFH